MQKRGWLITFPGKLFYVTGMMTSWKLDQYPSVGHLLDKGFTIWPSFWKMPEAALDLLDRIECNR